MAWLPPLCTLMVRGFVLQAEDGIRDDLVTGVQTCALPISICRFAGSARHPGRGRPALCLAEPAKRQMAGRGPGAHLVRGLGSHLEAECLGISQRERQPEAVHLPELRQRLHRRSRSPPGLCLFLWTPPG